MTPSKTHINIITERVRDFAGAIGLMHHEEFTHEEFPHAEVGRYALWWLKTVKRNSLTAITHHTKWVHESSIHAKERAVYEHEVLSHAIDAFVSIDQLNCPNLLGFELLIRRVILLEGAFSSEGGADFSMSDGWMRMSTRPGGALVAPGLLQTVSRKQVEKNAIAKERRKALRRGVSAPAMREETMVQLGHTRTSPVRATAKAKVMMQEDICKAIACVFRLTVVVGCRRCGAPNGLPLLGPSALGPAVLSNSAVSRVSDNLRPRCPRCSQT